MNASLLLGLMLSGQPCKAPGLGSYSILEVWQKPCGRELLEWVKLHDGALC